MHIKRSLLAFGQGLIAIALLLSPLHTVHAGIVDTESLLQSEQSALDRSALKAALARDDVASQLQTFGVSAEQALARVDRMTDSEIARLNDRIGELPAGGDLGSAILVVFVVLVFTDIIGATDIFPFIRPVTN